MPGLILEGRPPGGVDHQGVGVDSVPNADTIAGWAHDTSVASLQIRDTYMHVSARTDASAGSRWLLLIHQLPAKPAYFRVKVWRRLQSLGAVAVKNAVYALPCNEQTQEDFEWLLREITEGGGEAVLCEARLIEGLSDQEVRALFNRARDEDYDAIAKEARSIGAELGDEPPPEKRAEATGQLARLKSRLAQVVGIDFFGADRRPPAEGLLAELEERVAEPATAEPPEAASREIQALQNLRGRTWVTRQGVFVDRIASAWLIRRFIDPEARFKFVPAKGYQPAPGELRFDMFEAEFTHQGDRCTFEVLLEQAGLDDPALRAIAEIVHDIDLKDAKFGRDEAAGIASLIAGMARAHPKDEERLAQGVVLFENLYASFRNRRRAPR
jgi:hypothetical protein